jgi:hypothetical protein
VKLTARFRPATAGQVNADVGREQYRTYTTFVGCVGGSFSRRDTTSSASLELATDPVPCEPSSSLSDMSEADGKVSTSDSGPSQCGRGTGTVPYVHNVRWMSAAASP